MLNDDLIIHLISRVWFDWKIGLKLCGWIDDSSYFTGWDWVERRISNWGL